MKITTVNVTQSVLSGVLVVVVIAAVFDGWRRLHRWWNRRPSRSAPTIY